MFIGGSVCKSHKEALFYKGYGMVKVNMIILAYYRHERIVEDIALFGQDLLLITAGTEERSEMCKHFVCVFEPRDVVEIVFKTDEDLAR